MSQQMSTKQSHKQITQNDHTKQDDVMSKNVNDEQWDAPEQLRCIGGPETG